MRRRWPTSPGNSAFVASASGWPRLATEAEHPPWDVRYRTVSTLEELRSLVAEMRRQPRIAFDTETTSTNPRFAELVGCSFAWRDGEAYYVPLRAPQGEPQLELPAVLEILRPVLEQDPPKKVGQNAKYDVIVFRSAGIKVQGVECDTMVADYLLDPASGATGSTIFPGDTCSTSRFRSRQLIGTGKPAAADG